MRWGGLLLALALLLLPSPTYASDEGGKLAAVDEDAPDLPPEKLEAWNYYSIRATKFHHAGWAFIGLSTMMVIPGAVFSAMDTSMIAPAFIYVGIPFLCAASVGYGVGFGLFGKGWTEKKKARLLASGERSLDDLEWYPPEGMAPIRAFRRTVAGFVLAGLSLAHLAGGWIAFTVDAASGFRMGGGWLAWAGMQGGAYLYNAIGAPLLLHTHFKIRQNSGLKGMTPLQVAGWVFYGFTYATMPLYWGFKIPYIGIAGAVFVAISGALSITAGARSLEMIADLPEQQQKSSVTLMPFVSPVPGGVISGFAGSF